MENADIRWIQRFSNFNRAFLRFDKAVKFVKSDFDEAEDESPVVDELIKQGLIQSFEFTHELAWKVMKDYAHYQGNADIGGSRDATREAFNLQIINSGEVWMEMIQSRNLSSHTYNEDVAEEIFKKIIGNYHPALLSFHNHMEQLRSGQQGNLFNP